MTGALSISQEHPGGHVNDWPPGDALAWQRLVTAAERLVVRLGLEPMEAYHDSAVEIGLEGAEHHWLVDDALAHVHGLFYSHGAGDCYLGPASWLALADRRDLAKSWLVEEARRRCHPGRPIGAAH